MQKYIFLSIIPNFASVFLELARKMELNVLEVFLSHLKHIAAVGKEHVAALLVERHVLVLALLVILLLLRFLFLRNLYLQEQKGYSSS